MVQTFCVVSRKCGPPGVWHHDRLSNKGATALARHDCAMAKKRQRIDTLMDEHAGLRLRAGSPFGRASQPAADHPSATVSRVRAFDEASQEVLRIQPRITLVAHPEVSSDWSLAISWCERLRTYQPEEFLNVSINGGVLVLQQQRQRQIALPAIQCRPCPL